jgi:hypothetical protein
MTSKTLLPLILLALLTAAPGADAAPITLAYDFTATNFVDASSGVPSADAITGHFEVSFDNSVNIPESTTGISVVVNLLLSSTLGFAYFEPTDQLAIGGVQGTVGGLIQAPDAFDWRLLIDDVSTSPTFTQMHFSQGAGGLFISNTGTLTPTAPTPVPEPASMTLLSVGLAVALRARRRSSPHP